MSAGNPSGDAVLAAASSSPGEASRLAGQLQGLALAEGTATGWCVALKPPKSVQLVVLDCAAGGQWAETTADAWLQRVLLNQVGQLREWTREAAGSKAGQLMSHPRH